MKRLALILALVMSMMSTACQGRDGTILFGTYRQNSSRQDSISWIVLKVDGDKALLLSKNLLSARPWDETGKNLTWDNSSIRQWLNNEFLNAAFSQEEINDIIPTELDNSDQHGYGTPSGKNTTDKVFLLSVNEFDSLVMSRYATASPTKLSREEGAYTNGEGNSAWWLRSPGMTSDSPAYLSSAGELGTRAHKATEKVIGIRPAVWVKIKLISQSYK